MSDSRYKIQRTLYESSSSEALLARCTETHKDVVIKFHRESSRDRALLQLVDREFHILQRLISCPSVPRAIDVIPYKGQDALVMEYCPGRPLSERLQNLTLEQKFKIAEKIANILGRIHALSVIHKDVNPSNILVSDDLAQIWLVDFDIASIALSEKAQLAALSKLQGTLPYLAPEQTGRTHRSVDYRSDYYAFGITLYQLFSGRLPYEASDALGWIHLHLTRSIEQPPQHLPEGLFQLIRKLCMKNIEDRYQSAFGIQCDLRTMAAQIATGRPDPGFRIGQSDVPETFRFPQKVYGRAQELAELKQDYKSLAEGRHKIVLIGGSSGAGKSALIEEVNAEILNHGGHFISTQFAQFNQRESLVPLQAILEKILRHVHALDGESIDQLKRDIISGLDHNCWLVTNLAAGWTDLLGQWPDLLGLPPQENENRLLYSLHELLVAVSRFLKPLVLAIDDLQWADDVFLRFVRMLITTPIPHVMLIGSYRSHEIAADHAIYDLLQMQSEHDSIRSIVLPSLGQEAYQEFLRDMFQFDETACQELASILHQKTQGSPFFLRTLLQSLHRLGAIAYDSLAGRWIWHKNAIAMAAVSDNVADLVVTSLNAVSAEARLILDVGACLGRDFAEGVVQSILGTTSLDFSSAVDELVLMSFLCRLQPFEDSDLKGGSELQFAHDRIHQLVYQSINPERKSQLHKQIAQIFRGLSDGTEHSSDRMRFKRMAVHHGSRSHGRFEDEAERQFWCNLALEVAEDFREHSGYFKAFEILRDCQFMLATGIWQDAYAFSFRYHITLGECAFLSGHLHEADHYFRDIDRQQLLPQHRSQLYHLQMMRYSILNNLEEALHYAYKGLANMQVGRWNFLPGLVINLLVTVLKAGRLQLSDLDHFKPKLQDDMTQKVRFLADIPFVAYRANDEKLYAYAVFRLARMFFRERFTFNAASIVASIGAIFTGQFQWYSPGIPLGQMSLALLSRSQNKKEEASVYLIYAVFTGWIMEPWRSLARAFQKGIEVGLANGNFMQAAYCCSNHINWLFNTPLSFHIKEADRLLPIIKEARLVEVQYTFQFFQEMRRKLHHADGLDDLSFVDEDKILQICLTNNYRVTVGDFYLTKVMLCFFAGRYEEGRAYASHAHTIEIDFKGMHVLFWFHMFDTYNQVLGPLHDPSARAQGVRRLLTKRRTHIARLARLNPENFRHHLAALDGMMALLEQRFEKSLIHLDSAYIQAQKIGDRMFQAIFAELGLLACRLGGLQQTAGFWGQQAIDAYTRWEALAKVKALTRDIKGFETPEAQRVDTTLKGVITRKHHAEEELTNLSILKSTLALTMETDFDRMKKSLIEIMSQSGGATHGWLLLTNGSQKPTVAAYYNGERGVHWDSAAETHQEMEPPWKLIQVVMNSQQVQLVADCEHDVRLRDDPSVQHFKSKSALSVPLMIQKRLIGVVCLQNVRIAHAFSERQTELLGVLAVQAAIAIDNLYTRESLEERVRERTERIRRLEYEGAHLVQRALLARSADIPGVSIESYYKAAEYTGGDWYGYYHSEERGRIYVMMGDVTGHGLSAALITGEAAGALQSSLSMLAMTHVKYSMDEEIRLLGACVNETLFQSARQTNHLMTMAFIVFDLQSGEGCYLNAGHTPVMICKAERLQVLKGCSSPLGLVAEPKFVTTRFSLTPGDSLFVFTDGLLENGQEQKRNLKYRQLKSILQNDSSILIKKQALVRFIEENFDQELFEDDVAFLLINWLGLPKANVLASA